MVGKTAPIRDIDKVRFEFITNYCGCICCLLSGLKNAHCTIEHVTERGRRLDDEHQATIGLCEWHHFGTPWDGLSPAEMRERLGPALTDGRHVFEAYFGDEIDVLLHLQGDLILLFARQPWGEYDMPDSVAREIRSRWATLRG